MTVVFLILGFIIGISLASSAFVVALGGARNAVFWSFVQRHPIVGHLAKVWSVALVTACGVMFAYVGYSLIAGQSVAPLDTVSLVAEMAHR